MIVYACLLVLLRCSEAVTIPINAAAATTSSCEDSTATEALRVVVRIHGSTTITST
jgi:hypothetical protein